MYQSVIELISQGEKGIDGRKGEIGGRGMQGDEGERGTPVSGSHTVKYS